MDKRYCLKGGGKKMSRPLVKNNLLSLARCSDSLDMLRTELNKDINQTVLIGNGVAYPNNAATIVRNGAILGLTSLVLAPISKKIFDREMKNDKVFAEGFLKSFKIQKNNCIYTNRFIKGVAKYSVQHQMCLNMFYNFDAVDVIEMGLDAGFKVYMLENDVKGDIYDKDFSNQKVMFVVGNERFGVDDRVRDLYKSKKLEPLYIPACIEKSSMNVANAGTIAIYERNRQKRCESTVCDKKLTLNFIPSVNNPNKN